MLFPEEEKYNCKKLLSFDVHFVFAVYCCVMFSEKYLKIKKIIVC